MWLSYRGVVHDTLIPTACMKIHKEVTEDELLNLAITASHILDMLINKGRDTNCPTTCDIYAICKLSKNAAPNNLLNKWAIEYAKDLHYGSNYIEKVIISKQSILRYDKKEEVKKTGKKRKDDSQLSLF